MSLLKRLLGKRPKLDEAAERWFQSISAQSRLESFYSSGLVEDTFDGRFELTTLHATVVMRGLRRLDDDGRDLAQAVFDRLFKSFDYALREIGTGDLTVGKKIRKLGEAYYGRARAYDAALDDEQPEAALREAIVRNGLLQPNAGESKAADSVAAYVQSIDDAILQTPRQNLLSGDFNWPTPGL